MADRLQVLTARYSAYVDTYRGEDGKLPAMMQLKLTHTKMVVDAAKRIAAGEGFEARTAEVAEAAALLHDTGRYEQLKRYNTFRDSDSVDHAVFSHAIVKERGWLEGWADKDAILAAVLYHNRREIPTGLDSLTTAAAKVVRDADKLDIFRVLEDQIAHTDWRHDARAFWNLPTTKAPNPVVAAAIRAGRPVDYHSIESLADFVLIQVGWMISGLEYVTTRRLCAARGHLAYRRDFLHQLTDSPVVDELCDQAAQRLAAED
ncbi:MAG: HD domain-containing protein [Kiritimatiellia bacterium]